MALFYFFMLFFAIGAIALIGIVIFGIIMFFINIFSGKYQNILKILKMPETFILLALILICFIIPLYFKEFIENNVVLFYFIIGIPTIFIAKSLSHGLKNYKKDLFTWIFATLFGFASLSLCALLHYLLYRFMPGEHVGLKYTLESYIISTIVGIISIIVNLIEINTGNYKEKFAGVKNDN